MNNYCEGIMTDEQIIKALECCREFSKQSCTECPYHNFGHGCLTECFKDALDLINRQKAKIEEFADIGKMYSEVKAEAIKEFAERLKEKAKKNEWNGTICGLDIDELVKEMVGE